MTIDVIGYDRGGLVAGKLAELAGGGTASVTIGDVWLVGAPIDGTPFARTLGHFVNRATNLVPLLPERDVEQHTAAVLALVRHRLQGLTAPGVAAMDTRARDADPLRAIDGVRYRAVASTCGPVPGDPLIGVLLSDRLLAGPNDLFVAQSSAFGDADPALVATGDRLAFDPADGVTHAGYFAAPRVVDFLCGALEQRAATRSARPGGPTAAVEEAPRHDVPVVSISVTHASLEEANYALMVGGFLDEALSGAERYLDARLGGVLRAHYDVDQYAGALGTSLFIDPDPDAPTMPPAAHVVGLGSTTELGRAELAYGVRQALMRRCLRLYDKARMKDEAMVEVGVSSILLGVRNHDGLTVQESVAGIVQGVLDANQGLKRYKESLGERYQGPLVQVTHLELIERYGERGGRGRDRRSRTRRGHQPRPRLRPLEGRRQDQAGGLAGRVGNRRCGDRLATVPHHPGPGRSPCCRHYGRWPAPQPRRRAPRRQRAGGPCPPSAEPRGGGCARRTAGQQPHRHPYGSHAVRPPRPGADAPALQDLGLGPAHRRCSHRQLPMGAADVTAPRHSGRP